MGLFSKRKHRRHRDAIEGLQNEGLRIEARYQRDEDDSQAAEGPDVAVDRPAEAASAEPAEDRYRPAADVDPDAGSPDPEPAEAEPTSAERPSADVSPRSEPDPASASEPKDRDAEPATSVMPAARHEPVAPEPHQAEAARTLPAAASPEPSDDDGDDERGSESLLLGDPKLRQIRRRTDEENEPERRLSPEEMLAPRRTPSPAQAATGHGEEGGIVRGAQIIAFANQKGGVAKTTTTLNLGVALAEQGYRVLCIDMDPQGNLTMSQGIDPDRVEKSMYDVLVHHTPISEVIAKREIDIACASIDLAGAEIAMSTQIGRERSLQKGLAAVVGEYDYMCIDTPPSLGLLTINALTAAHKVIVPVQCEYLSMRGLVQLQNTLAMIRENLNPDVEIEGILPTMMDTRTVHAKEAIEILEENFGDRVFQSRIRKTIKFAEAPVRGSSVLKYDPEGRAANYYRDLAQEVLSHGAE